MEFVTLNMATVQSWVSTLGDLIESNESNECQSSLPSTLPALAIANSIQASVESSIESSVMTPVSPTPKSTNTPGPTPTPIMVPTSSNPPVVHHSNPYSPIQDKHGLLTPPIEYPRESPRSLETVHEEEPNESRESKACPSPAPTLLDGSSTLNSNTSSSCSGDSMKRINTFSSSDSTVVNEVPYVVKVDWTCQNSKKTGKIAKSQYLFLYEQYQKKLKEIKHLKTCLELIEESHSLLR